MLKNKINSAPVENVNAMNINENINDGNNSHHSYGSNIVQFSQDNINLNNKETLEDLTLLMLNPNFSSLLEPIKFSPEMQPYLQILKKIMKNQWRNNLTIHEVSTWIGENQDFVINDLAKLYNF